MTKMSMSSYLLQRLLAVLLLFCLSKASGGTCLSYGHSCWGGHGKRSGSAHMIGPSSQKHTSGWFISKFLDPRAADPKDIEAIFKSKNSHSEEVVENGRQSGYQSYLGSDAERNTRLVQQKYNMYGYPEITCSPTLQKPCNRLQEGNSEKDLKIKKWGPESDEEIMVLTPEVQRLLPLSKVRLFPIMNQEEEKSRNEY